MRCSRKWPGSSPRQHAPGLWIRLWWAKPAFCIASPCMSYLLVFLSAKQILKGPGQEVIIAVQMEEKIPTFVWSSHAGPALRRAGVSR